MDKKLKVTFVGETDLLMSWDNIYWRENVSGWQKDPANRSKKVAGDDRCPAWGWMGRMYTENGLVCMPSDNLQKCLSEGGSKVGTGKTMGDRSYKKLVQSYMLVNESSWPVLINGAPIDALKLHETLSREGDFKVHEEVVRNSGFSLFLKAVRIGKAKHVRVRPRFANWSVSGTITVFDTEVITVDTCKTILEYAGICGLGDWRPSSPTAPGLFGRFSAKVENA